ncbi:MAG: DUF3048 domain-containing protein [Mogibacterium sp.]|nr:DUF3048 domain-containing protein [Mogibacterium sp.]
MNGGMLMKDPAYKKYLALLLCLIMTLATLLSSCGAPEEEEAEIPAPPSNLLTGETAEEGYDESASDRRVAAFVVENTPDARPQWGLDDENYSPDIVLQGEVEGGITRTLWMYADYNKLPEIIGPTRSARPPYIKFANLFDSIFIHWGMSHSKGDYVGATTIFNRYHVDHINQMTLDDKEGMYGRDQTRAVSAEHRGIIYGEKVPATIANEGFRTEPEKYSELCFNFKSEPVSDTSATNVGVTYSERSFDETYWTYNEEDGMYHTSSFENDFARKNLLVLYDDTEYITKYDYQGGGGGAVTYCDYKLAGGKAQLFSEGTVKDIEWKVEDGKLLLIDPEVKIETVEDLEAMEANNKAIWKAHYSEDVEEPAVDEEGNELPYNRTVLVVPELEEDQEQEDILSDIYAIQQLNVGKTWIGWVSRNNGCKVSVS